MLIQADDKIELITDKTRTDGSGVKIGLSEDWRQSAEIVYNNSGEPVIYSYWDGDKTFYSPTEIKKLSFEDRDKLGELIPCFERVVKTSIPESYIRLRGNNIFLSLCKLSYGSENMLFSSRYRKLLETFHEARPSIFEYTGRGGSRPIEASRLKLLRWFRLYEYEFNILFIDREFGLRVFNELKLEAQQDYETGLYMKGLSNTQKKNTTIKMYEVENGLYKLELTFRKDTFKKLLIDITDMTRQENCIELLRNSAVLEVMKLKGGEAVRQLQLEFVKENNILSRILKLEAEQLRTDKRLETTDKRLETLEKQDKIIEAQLRSIRKLLEKAETRN